MEESTLAGGQPRPDKDGARTEVRRSIVEGSKLSAPYLVMNALATAVASYGLLADSAAVVIGAMIIAMLLGPIMGLALALVDGDTRLLRDALIAEAVGALMVVFIGGFIGAGVLALVLSGKTGGYNIQTSGLGQNVFTNYSVLSAFLAEMIGTLIFTVTILGATQKNGGGNVAGLVIGLTLALIHILLIPVTGTSVNPARTLAPNIYVGGQALAQVWLFMVAPIVGGLIAGFLFRCGLFNADK